MDVIRWKRAFFSLLYEFDFLGTLHLAALMSINPILFLSVGFSFSELKAR
jgi:hypothetical protein